MKREINGVVCVREGDNIENATNMVSEWTTSSKTVVHSIVVMADCTDSYFHLL